MRSTRGFTLFELLIVVALIGILSAVAIPTLNESTNRNAVWTASETIGSQLRQARLKAISRNTSFQVRFDCPVARQFRVLVVDATIGNLDRCSTTQQFDSGVFAMPSAVGFGAVNTLEVNGRGVYSSIGGAIPQTITVTDGTRSRTLTVTATGQITFGVF